MSEILVVVVNDCSNSWLREEDKPVLEALVHTLAGKISEDSARSVLLATSAELECIHFSSFLARNTGQNLNLSFNLSQDYTYSHVCDSADTQKLSIGDILDVNYSPYGEQRLPAVNQPLVFANYMAELFDLLGLKHAGVFRQVGHPHIRPNTDQRRLYGQIQAQDVL